MFEKRLSRRTLLRSAAIGGAAVALAACAPAEPKVIIQTQIVEKEVAKEVIKEVTKEVLKEKVVQQTVVVKEAAQQVVLRFAYWSFNIQNQGLIQHAFMDEFPGIRIKEEITSFGQYWQKLLTATAAGDAPDVMAHSPYYHVQFAANRVTMALDPFIERDQVNLQEFYEAALNQGRWQKGRTSTGAGELHAFPSSWHSGTTFFYNKKLFDDAGVPYPDPDPAKRMDWDDLLEAAKLLTKTDAQGALLQAGMNTPVNGNGWITNWIFSAGGDLFDENESKCLIKSDAAMESFRYCVDMVIKHKVALPPDPAAQVNPFETSKVAMSLSGDWMMIPWQAIKDFGWDIFPSPVHPGTGKSIIDAYQNGMAITTSTKYKDEAWTWLKWRLMGPGVQKSLDINKVEFTAHIPTAESRVYVKNRQDPPVSLWLLGEDLKVAKSVFNGPNPGEVAQIISEEQQGAFLGVKTVEQAADDMEKRVNSALEKAAADILKM